MPNKKSTTSELPKPPKVEQRFKLPQQLSRPEKYALAQHLLRQIGIDGDDAVGLFLLIARILYSPHNALDRFEMWDVLRETFLPYTSALGDAADAVMARAYNRQIKGER